MADRDRMIELMQNATDAMSEHIGGIIATYLAENGVTVNEWISVEDRLPSESGKYLVCTKKENVYQTKFYSYPESTGGHWGQKDKGRSITYWMPLPQAPKGEK